MELFMGILKNLPDAISLGILWGIMCLGVYITFKILDIADLTVDGTFALGGCITATLVVSGVNPILSLIAATLAGMIAGYVTGFLHTKLKIPAILAGILTMLSLYSINLKVLAGKSNLAMPQIGGGNVKTVIDIITNLTGLSNRSATLVFGIIIAIICMVVLYWFFGTEIGSAIRATGNNEDMVRALGVNTDTMKIIGLVISNGLVSLSGAMVAQSQRYGDVGMGTGTIVIGLASIIIGEVILTHARSFKTKLFSVVLGSIIYRVIIAVVLRLGMNPNDLKLLTAIIVALALSLPIIKSKLNMRKKIKINKEINGGEV
ncbi:ABC transporter permease [Anaerofustis stercorihominis]|uniref:ABC transporter permease n=1 Tax=Anaerofustis stercorihominis TaxID=214853 RepID=UPI00210BB6E7|nr:ABC transporter permease [Anaerofustis stercorihominis]MCQ4794741.1 ABC transporter permease [Anaerofustis stercorihominis]